MFITADRRLRELGDAYHQVDAGIRVIGGPAHAEILAPDAPVPELANGEVGIGEALGHRADRDAVALGDAAPTPLGFGRDGSEPDSDERSQESGQPSAAHDEKI